LKTFTAKHIQLLNGLSKIEEGEKRKILRPIWVEYKISGKRDYEKLTRKLPSSE